MTDAVAKAIRQFQEGDRVHLRSDVLNMMDRGETFFATVDEITPMNVIVTDDAGVVLSLEYFELIVACFELRRAMQHYRNYYSARAEGSDQ